MNNLGQINLQAIVIFGIMMVVAALTYIAFFKQDVDRRLRSSKRSHS